MLTRVQAPKLKLGSLARGLEDAFTTRTRPCESSADVLSGLNVPFT